MNQQEYFFLPGESPAAPAARGDSNPRKLPRVGVSIATALLDRRYDIDAWAQTIGKYFFGRGWTRINLMTAPWPENVDHIVWPFRKHADGKFDLYDWNPEFWDERLPRFMDAHNSQGTVVQGDLLELYSMSYRKKVAFDRKQGPYYNNVNGVRFLSIDRKTDDILLTTILPNSLWLRDLTHKFAEALRGYDFVFEPANEFPEKALHELLAKWWREKNPDGVISVNRNEDTPGQYQNSLHSSSGIDMLSHHGWKDLGFLDKLFLPARDEDQRKAAMRPWSFREFFENRHHNGNPGGYDFSRVICSSDGSRSSSDIINTYDYDALFGVFQFVHSKGVTIEHQSRQKMVADGTLHNVEHDFLDRLARL